MGFAVAVFFMLTAFAIFVINIRVCCTVSASLANILISCAVALAFAYVYERGSEKARAGLLVIASTDPLTRLANLYRFREAFQQERHRAQRLGSALSLLVLDLDYFKRVNDTHGHAVGDQVLIHVANILRRRLRASDLVCRVGGEEFTVLLPDTGLEEAIKVADSLRRLIRDTPYRERPSPSRCPAVSAWPCGARWRPWNSSWKPATNASTRRSRPDGTGWKAGRWRSDPRRRWTRRTRLPILSADQDPSPADTGPQGEVMSDTRLEKDSLGEIEVPAEALWGAQTQRAVEAFRSAAGTCRTAFRRWCV